LEKCILFVTKIMLRNKKSLFMMYNHLSWSKTAFFSGTVHQCTSAFHATAWSAAWASWFVWYFNYMLSTVVCSMWWDAVYRELEWILKNCRFLCEISSSHSAKYEAQNLLGCTAMFLIECRPMFQRYVLPPSSPWWLRTWQYIPEDSELHCYFLFQVSIPADQGKSL
jgi:hypothetical protein